MRLRTLAEPGRIASGTLAVLVHLMFFGLLVFGVSWQKKVASPVMVELWQDLPEPVKKVLLAPEPPKPVPKPPKPVPEVKKEPPPPPPVPKVVEPPKPSAADIEYKEKLRKQKEEEAQRQEDLKKAEAERKEEQKKEELEKRKLEDEQRKEAELKRREEAEQKRVEQEKQRKDDETRRADDKKRADDQKRVDDAKREEERKQHEADEAKRKAEAAARAEQQKQIDEWRARIQAKIKGRVVVPPNVVGNPEARFDIVLLPGGEVLSAKLKKPSGNPAYDAAVERAIMAAQPLPVPTDTDLFQENFRELPLIFRPKDKD